MLTACPGAHSYVKLEFTLRLGPRAAQRRAVRRIHAHRLGPGGHVPHGSRRIRKGLSVVPSPVVLSSGLEQPILPVRLLAAVAP